MLCRFTHISKGPTVERNNTPDNTDSRHQNAINNIAHRRRLASMTLHFAIAMAANASIDNERHIITKSRELAEAYIDEFPLTDSREDKEYRLEPFNMDETLMCWLGREQVAKDHWCARTGGSRTEADVAYDRLIEMRNWYAQELGNLDRPARLESDDQSTQTTQYTRPQGAAR